MPTRRATDQFDPKPMPRDEGERKQQSWYNQQMILFQVSRMNGTQQDHSTEIGKIKSDVAKGKAIVALLGSGGVIGMFWKKIMGVF